MTAGGGGRGAARRRATFEAGHWAERLALVALALKGYRVLARRYAVHGGEIDIVAKRGRLVVFVEVKARASLDAAVAAVTPRKRERIAKAAAVWLVRNPWATGCVLRGDAVLILPRRWPVHLPDAFPLRIG